MGPNTLKVKIEKKNTLLTNYTLLIILTKFFNFWEVIKNVLYIKLEGGGYIFFVLFDKINTIS